jgi:hypothetical protein
MPNAEICEDASNDAQMRSAEPQNQAEFLNMRGRAVTTPRGR